MSSDPDFDLRDGQPLLIVISGPSAAGKDTVVRRMQERGLKFHFVVTATTRPRRPDEVHGRDYWFVTHEEFARMIEHNELIEYAIAYDTTPYISESIKEVFRTLRDAVLLVAVVVLTGLIGGCL